MDETVKNEVSGEIENQGEDTQKSPLMLKLEKYRITPEDGSLLKPHLPLIFPFPYRGNSNIGGGLLQGSKMTDVRSKR